MPYTYGDFPVLVLHSAVHSSISSNNTSLQVKEDGDVKYSDVNPYCSPAEREEDLYMQIKSQGITTIQSKSIEYVVQLFLQN